MKAGLHHQTTCSTLSHILSFNVMQFLLDRYDLPLCVSRVGSPPWDRGRDFRRPKELLRCEYHPTEPVKLVFPPPKVTWEMGVEMAQDMVWALEPQEDGSRRHMEFQIPQPSSGSHKLVGLYCDNGREAATYLALGLSGAALKGAIHYLNDTGEDEILDCLKDILTSNTEHWLTGANHDWDEQRFRFERERRNEYAASLNPRDVTDGTFSLRNTNEGVA